MNPGQLTEFFKGSGTRLGVFYPMHCMTAVFPAFATAQDVAAKLRMAGFPSDDVIAATGSDVLAFDEERITFGREVMRALSRFFKTEQSFADHDLEHAHQHAGFVIVRCKDEALKQSAWSVVQAADPLDARYYALAGIEHLAGDPDTD